MAPLDKIVRRQRVLFLVLGPAATRVLFSTPLHAFRGLNLILLFDIVSHVSPPTSFTAFRAVDVVCSTLEKREDAYPTDLPNIFAP